ncbi:MAG: glycosyltransferase family 2 protein [Candidatus Omnitrophica bacterium]|nr:glycosyltransferase family 2 protein [Candidatus Omnitrophota bacterium]
MENKILLTIAIPTYNRCGILDETLQGYFNDPDLDERIEIVVSDNGSSDNTPGVTTKYLNSHKNFLYSRNQENIYARNFTKALSLGSGEYIRLANDNVEPTPGTLKFMLDTIQQHLPDKKQIFFYQNTWQCKNTHKEVSDLNGFISLASFFSTWISNFGAWRSDFIRLPEKDKYIHLGVTQVDWTLRLVQAKKKACIYFGDYFVGKGAEKKNEYNIFKTFAEDYLSVYNEYLSAGTIDAQTMLQEKYNLFRYFIVPWMKNIFVTKISQEAFDTHNWFSVLYGCYGRYPYFYLGLAEVLLSKIFYRNRRMYDILNKPGI